MRISPARIALLVLVSGCCALVYQLVWTRELRLVFGASTPASAAVLAVFMGGIGLGGLLLGRRAERVPQPLAFYGALELGVALFAGISPWTIAGARRLYLATGGSEALGAVGATLLRLLLAAVVLGVPTFLMGGTLPAVGRAATTRRDDGRRVLGLLYGANTLGAVAGAALSTFLLLEALGQRKSLLIAALLNALVGMTARSWARAGAAENGGVEADTGQHASAAPLGFVLTAAALVGFAFFLMEMVWYRLLAPLLGGSTYTFGTILLLALLGIGGGGLIYGALAAERAASLRALAITCALEALLLVAPLALGFRLALLTAVLRQLVALGFGGLVAGWLLVGGLVVVPPALVAGYQFPLLIALLGRGRAELARQTGLVTACNTAGAIAGALAGGFGLLPWLGAAGAWRATTLLLALLAIVAATLARRAGAPAVATATPLAIAAVALLLCLAPGPGTLWREGEIGGGRFDLAAHTPNDLRERLAWYDSGTIWEEDGRESGVSLQAFSGYAFAINGKVDGHARGDASTQVMAPLVGAMLHPAPRRSLVIGLGTGSSAGWLAAVPGMERVDVVELEPAVLRVARDCAAVNRDVLHDPRVHVHLGDGRELLLTSDRRWDVIFSEPSNPYRAGIASLFTSEFYRAAAGRLAPGGVFLQWLQAYEVDAEVVASIYASLGGTFPYVETWSTNDSDLLLVASLQPIRHDVARVAARAAAPPYRRALADTWGVAGVEGFYSGFLAGPGLARRLAAAGIAANTDDRPLVEFGFARDLGASTFSSQQLRAQVRPDEALPPGVTLDRRRLDGLRAARLLQGLGGALPSDREGADAQLAWLRGHGDGLTDPGVSLIGYEIEAEALAERRDPRVPAIAAQLLGERPVEAHALLARYLLATGERAEAAVHLEQALVGYRADPWPSPRMMERALSTAPALAVDAAATRRLLAAVAAPFAVRMCERQRQLVRVTLADRLPGGECRAAYRDYEPHPRWEESFLRHRLACYRRTGDPLAARAAGDLDDFLAAQPLRLAEALRGGN